jgi:hypothetical protein
MNTIRNRIKTHRRVRAGDLVPHELNFRRHPHYQQRALRALYEEVGFARSLLAYELPDGRLKLLDGHLRRDIDPDMEVEVEVLDLNDEEARVLLLSIDPLASLAETQEQIHQRLLDVTPVDDAELKAAWEAAAEKAARAPLAPWGRRADGEGESGSPLSPFGRGAGGEGQTLVDQFYVILECRDEAHQVELLKRFTAEGFKCKAALG